MAINKIKEVIHEKGMVQLIPSDDILKELGVKLHSWNKWVNKTTDPDFQQVPIIARFLNCALADLFPEVEENTDQRYVSKHKLIS